MMGKLFEAGLWLEKGVLDLLGRSREGVMLDWLATQHHRVQPIQRLKCQQSQRISRVLRR